MTSPIDEEKLAAAMVSRALRRPDLRDRSKFLRELMAHSAAAIALMEGERAAGEAAYRIADAVVSREKT